MVTKVKTRMPVPEETEQPNKPGDDAEPAAVSGADDEFLHLFADWLEARAAMERTTSPDLAEAIDKADELAKEVVAFPVSGCSVHWSEQPAHVCLDAREHD